LDTLRLCYENCLIPQKRIFQTAERLEPEIENMRRATSKGYSNERASINLPDDRVMLESVEKVIEDKLQLRPEYLVVVGIGGSDLGTIAVQEAVLGKLHNQLSQGVKVLYADTTDSDYINCIIEMVESALKRSRNVIVNGISKSGTTTETIANFEILLDLLQKHQRDCRRCVVVTSDRDSNLWSLAAERNFDALEIPRLVGGRYSVLSPVGLFPLGLLGVNIRRLLEGARVARDMCVHENIKENPAAISASVKYLHCKKRKNIFDLFLFSNDMEAIGKWHRQLMAESLGKEFSRKGRKVNVGITPTVSIGSTDLHSVAQLYLGGPYDKFTTFVRVERNKTDLLVPKMEGHAELVPGIRGKSLNTIMDAIFEGTKIAFKRDKRPFIEVTLPDKSEYSIGQFLQFKMMETIYLGYLLGVQPFDQPDVESYKKEARRILSRTNSWK